MEANMMSDKLQTPVLFIIFNRPEATRLVFEEIRKARPSRLFVAADGPRDNMPGERELCESTRSLVQQVDWDCEVNTLFRDKNLGCRIAVSTAIDWFFENVTEGIILEDDCLPDPSFFPFCHELLEYYRDDERIMMIAGTNFLRDANLVESYYFTKYYAIWGWATWKRAWSLYDREMSGWPKFRDSGQLQWIYADRDIADYFDYIFQAGYTHEVDTWDYQWVYSCIFQNGLCIAPKFNLITNIGLLGAHTPRGSENRFNNMPTRYLDISGMAHPGNVTPDVSLDKKNIYRALDIKLKTKIKGFMKRLINSMFRTDK
jgi:hypothetical protein